MRGKILFYPLFLLILMSLLSFFGCIRRPRPVILGLILSLWGRPTEQYREEARNINELKFFEGKLYIGYGDAGANTGPTDVIYYDFDEEEFVNEFTVDEEAITKYQVLDEKLVIPGMDATESWDFGNIYVLTESGWIKHRTLTRAHHVWELASFKDAWYAAISTHFEFGIDYMYPFDAILVSMDEGDSWSLIYSTPYIQNCWTYMQGLLVYRDELYVFPYVMIWLTEEQIPAEYRPYLGPPVVNQGIEYYLTFLPDPFGDCNALVYDGIYWRNISLIPEQNVCQIKPFDFNDKLLLYVVSGEFVAPARDYVERERKLPHNVSTSLYEFDGTESEKLQVEFELIRDVLIKNDKLFLLVLQNEQYYIAETSDLQRWTYYIIDPSLGVPLSIEWDGSLFFYIGMKSGLIYRGRAVQDS